MSEVTTQQARMAAAPEVAAPAAGPGRRFLPESASYRLKRLLLGPPLVSERLSEERLSQPVALGVLAPDCISSTAYGSEEMLREMVPFIGLAAFSLLVPVTVAILVVLFFVTLSYREVVMVYTKAGGSYVVARDNFGRNVAQISAVALLIDYVVTVAVQTAAGTDALVSAVPALSSFTVPITVGVVILLLWGNLRGIREAGKTFAFPTYFFITMVGSVVVVGLIRAALGALHVIPFHNGMMTSASSGHPQYMTPGVHGEGLLMGLALFYLLRSFANGGSSLTGLEAISNGVSAFKPPEGPHARRVLVIMSTTLGSLVLGVSLLARFTHALPYTSGTPTVISQVAKTVFGHGAFGSFLFYLVQLASLLILYTGANTSFNGFPFLASFVAEDAFLPRWLTKRGHRLTFSNGILVLAGVSIILLIVTRAQVSSLVAVYAIGVFTGFTMAGAGMTKHHLTHREPGYRHKMFINGSAAVLSAIVVAIFAITKFTEGAYVVVVLFPIMVWGLIRLNHEYRQEAAVLETGAGTAAEAPILRRHTVLVLVDRLDLATARATQYARTLTPDELRAVHFVIDAAHARDLANRWTRLGLARLPLELLECPDRRITRAALQLADEVTADGNTELSILLPRRAYTRMWSSLLHDRTADKIVEVVSQLPHVNATIVPFHVYAALERRRAAEAARAARKGAGQEEAEEGEPPPVRPVPGAVPIAELRPRQQARVAARVRSVTVQPWAGVPSLECTLTDSTGRLLVAFLGRRSVPGVQPGARLVVEGVVGSHRGQMAIINPYYELLPAGDGDGAAAPGPDSGR